MAITIGKNKIVTIGFLIFSLAYLLVPSMWREDWRTLNRNINGPVYMIGSFEDPIKYYNPNIKIYDIRQISLNLPSEDLGTSLTKEGLENVITVIPYGEEIHGVDHKAILEKAGYIKKTETDYREVTLETWQKI